MLIRFFLLDRTTALKVNLIVAILNEDEVKMKSKAKKEEIIIIIIREKRIYIFW